MSTEPFRMLIGQKLGMTQIFDEEGAAIPVTVLELLPMVVTQVKTKATDGYNAIQVGFRPAKAKHLTKARKGHLEKNGLPLLRNLTEIRLTAEEVAQYSVGAEVDLSTISEGLVLDATGQSIGKGFQGNTFRWNHGRGPMSHGSKSHRLPGSIGAGTTPGRVFKGLNMAGRMGNEKVTVKNLRVVRVIAEKNLVLIRGSVPGVEGGLIYLKPKRARWNNPAVQAS